MDGCLGLGGEVAGRHNREAGVVGQKSPAVDVTGKHKGERGGGHKKRRCKICRGLGPGGEQVGVQNKDG
jgi:hypothetical protein